MTTLAGVARRSAATIRECRNWPELIGRIGLERLGRPLRRPEMRFRFRNGVVVDVPANLDAWYPVVEVVVGDDYGLGGFRRRRGGKPLVVLDVGAHVGSFVIRLAMEGPISRAICAEPSPQTASFLLRNLRRNHLEECVEVVEAAVLAAGEGEVDLYSRREADGGTSVVWPLEGAQLVARVPVVPFEQLRRRVGERVDICKLDCEGAEYGIVCDTPAEVWAGVDNVVLEYHPVPGRSWEQLRSRLLDLGYRMQWHRPGVRGVAWFSRDLGSS